MPRALRIEYPGAHYHVMARGQRRDLIYRDDRDRGDFLELLGKASQRYGWEVLGYVLMGNHYHLLLETQEPNLSVGMHWLQTSFGTRHRLRHGLSGSVFGGRYKALLIERDARHLGTVLEYIHLNPWRAGLVTLEEGLESNRWSSLCGYVAPPKKRSSWLAAATGLTWLDFPDTAAGRRRYLKTLEERTAGGTRLSDEARALETDWKTQLRRGWYFGGQEFQEAMLKRASKQLKESGDPRGVIAGVRKDISASDALQLVEKACDCWGMKLDELRARAKGDGQKVLLAWVVRERYAVSLGWLSETLKLGVAAAACRLLSRIKDTSLLSKQEKQWLNQLNKISR